MSYNTYHVLDKEQAAQPGLSFEAFYNQASLLPAPPQVEKQTSNMYAVLQTNEILIPPQWGHNETTDKLPEPDGYVIAIGAGNMFNLPQLYPQDSVPRGIVGIDHMANVVLAGRFVADALKSSPGRSVFIDKVNTANRESLEAIIQQESNTETRSRLTEEVDSVLAALYTEHPELGIDGANSSIQNVISSILSQFDTYHTIALEDNLKFLLQDITNPQLISLVTSRFPRFPVGRMYRCVVSTEPPKISNYLQRLAA